MAGNPGGRWCHSWVPGGRQSHGGCGGILVEGGPTVGESLFEVAPLFLDSDSIQNGVYVIHRHRPSSSGSCIRSKEAFY